MYIPTNFNQQCYHLLLLYLHTQLGSFDGCNIATRTRSDDTEISIMGGGVLP